MSADKIFICYSNKDSKFANDLANKLIISGAKVWIESLHGNDDDEVVEEAIKTSKIMLIITSEYALKDETLKQEKDFARHNNIDRLLVKIDSCNTAGKMRWKLSTIDFTGNQSEAFKKLLDKLEIQSNDNSNIANNKVNQNTEATISNNVTENNSNEKVETKVEEIISEKNEINNPEIAKKASLLVSTEEIESVRALFKKQIKESKVAIGLFVAASVIIGVLVFVIFKFDLFSAEQAKEVATTAETTYDKLTKFFPAIGAILPNAFSGISASKISDKKKRLAIVDKLERTRDRIETNLNSTPESEIRALEEKLEELITL